MNNNQKQRKKLIEVAIPLEAINVASVREKSMRHGHPSALHLWWARRPLAACRAVLFAQLVDDPSSWPDRFRTTEEQEAERRRLHRVIEDMVRWEASNDEHILNAARWEIARSVAWNLGEEPPEKGDGKAILDYLQSHAPPVYDPFSGGGSIPLEAQRLGLRAYGADLNPVAVLIGKALIEIPPKFRDQAPVNPDVRSQKKRGGKWNGTGVDGLAEDVRFYGNWMRAEAFRRIGHLYPSITLPDGSGGTVVAWIWARTVRSPDPGARGAMVPMASSFLLSTKEGKKAWIEPILDADAQDGYRFEVRSGPLSKSDEERLKKGTKFGRGSFRCVLTGSAIDLPYVRNEANTQGLSTRLLAIIADSPRGRVYCSPTLEQERAAVQETPAWGPEEVVTTPSHDVDRLPMYGMPRWRDAFTSRQLVALTTFSELVSEVRGRIVRDAQVAHFGSEGARLEEGGIGAIAYADAVSTYLAFLVGQMANHSASVCGWNSANSQMRSVFARQAIPMVWDFAEVNLFSESSGSFSSLFERLCKAFSGIPKNAGPGSVRSCDAQGNSFPPGSVFSTDPPYYDNIGYADLSDFFYVWLKPTLKSVWPELFRRITTPKDEELIAAPYRHGGKKAAEAFFMRGMSRVFLSIAGATEPDQPVSIYYAFKQAEAAAEGTTSSGWASILQAIVDAGLVIDGTWPLDTEKKGRVLEIGTNALASSIVLVCRRRNSGASVATRADFIRALKREMPVGIDAIRKAGVGPVDMQQSVIGPGMGVFSRYARVLEDDDSTMSVKTALSLINRVWEEIENELDQAFDSETQVALAWFATYGFDTRASGELITLANAKNVSLGALFASGVFADGKGKTGLTARSALDSEWQPAADKGLTVWECVQHTARVLNAEEGGGEAAARLVAQMGPKAAEARALAYRLYEIASAKGWANEALVYNELAQEWPRLEDLAQGIAAGRPDPRASQGAFAFAGET